MIRSVTIAALAASAGIANADIVNMGFTGTKAGQSLRITAGDLWTRNLHVGQLEHEISNATGVNAALNGRHLTYCADLLQTVTRDRSTEYELVDVAEIPKTQDANSAMGNARAAALQSLYSAYGQAATTQGANRDLAAAFQLLVWEIVSDFDASAGNNGLDSISLTSGFFSATKRNGSAINGGLLNQFNTLTQAIDDGTTFPTLFGLANGDAQDQLIIGPPTIIPTPGAMAIVGLAAIGTASRRRRV